MIKAYRTLIMLSMIVTVVVVASPDTVAYAQSVNIRIQTPVPAEADELIMLKDFTDRVTRLTSGDITFSILSSGALIPSPEILDAVDEGRVEAGFAWTHYWTRYHPAAMLFGSPVAGASVGIDNVAFLSWYLHDDGKPLYDQLWQEMGMNIKGLILQPTGPEALGWFHAPITSMDDLRKMRFRVPPGTPGQIYEDIGVETLPLAAADIVPALEGGLIDAAEWCCPNPDRLLGLQSILKHYYLQGLHQVVVNADIYINGDVWRRLTPSQRDIIEVAADASLIRSMTYRIRENGIALGRLTRDDGVLVHDTPDDYFDVYLDAARREMERSAANNAFFKKVWESQRMFAETTIPFWANAQRANANLGQAYLKTLK